MLKAAIDELARRFAAASAGGIGRQRLRERTEDLVLDLLDALKKASMSEIAETTRALERRRKTRVSARATSRAALSSAIDARKADSAARAEASEAADRPAAATRNPFEITIPGELLDAPRGHGSAHRSPRRASRKPRKPGSDLMEVPSPTPAATTAVPRPAIEQAPARSVSLREGEELLRTGGAGAIIRRVRGS